MIVEHNIVVDGLEQLKECMNDNDMPSKNLTLDIFYSVQLWPANIRTSLKMFNFFVASALKFSLYFHFFPFPNHAHLGLVINLYILIYGEHSFL